MKISFGVLILLLVVPLTADGHSEIFFTKVFSPAELSTTGFVFLNPDSSIAAVTVALFNTAGSPVSRNDLQIGPGSQMARLGSELFKNMADGGWVWAFVDTEGMQAFWLNYDAGITFLDGAEAGQYDTIGPDQVIPLVGGQTELSVISPNGINVSFTARLFGNDGELAAAYTGLLPVAGAFRGQLSVMFPVADMTQARYIRIRSSGAPIASSALIRNFLVSNDSAVVNGENAGFRTELNFPHVISGSLTGADYTTVIALTNLSSSSQPVTFTFNPEQGSSISVTRTVSGNGALRETAQSLFGIGPEFRSGWVRVSGTAPLIGVAAYADGAGGGLAVVPAATAQTHLFFSHIANGPPQWQTGLALLNAGSVPASVQVYAITPSGVLIGGAIRTLDPGQKIANAIHELIPQTHGVNGGFVYVRTTNNVPLFGIELFYTEDLKVLSNVAAGKLVSGIVYTPPPP